MYRGRHLAGVLTISFLSLCPFARAFGQQAKRTTSTPVKVAAKLKASDEVQKKKSHSSWELGVGYLNWNEKLNVSLAGQSTLGFANYAGFSFTIDKTWRTANWFFGSSLEYGFGKTSAGGFVSSPAFADGINRSWWVAQAKLSGLFRIRPAIMIGIGLLSRQRSADWSPSDSTLTVEPMANFQTTGQLILRWQVSPRFSLMQSFSPLGLDGSTLWEWSAKVSL